MQRTRLLKGLAVAAVSTAVAGGAAWWFLYWRLDAQTMVLFDTTEEVRALLESRAAGGAREMPGLDALGRMLPDMVAAEVDEEVAALFYPAVQRRGFEFVPHVIFRREPHKSPWQRFPEHPDGGWHVTTNDLGLREDEDVRAERPDLRVLVMGDSHVEGACANSESLANQLEALFAAEREGTVDVLNAARGAYDPFNYLGSLAAYGDLEPHVLVVVVYGGNDFLGVCGLRRYLFRRGPHRKTPYRRDVLLDGDDPRSRNLLGQELDQVLHLLNNPEEKDVALAVTCAITAELARQCAERGVRFLAVYLPPPSTAQPEIFREELVAALARVEAPADALGVADELAAGWLAFLAQRGIAFVDLTAHLRGAGEQLYWTTDLHLNVAGHARAAAALKPALELLVE